MAPELEIRKEQRHWLFLLMEIKQENKEVNNILNVAIARHQVTMMEEDVALVEKTFNSLYTD